MSRMNSHLSNTKIEVLQSALNTINNRVVENALQLLYSSNLKMNLAEKALENNTNQFSEIKDIISQITDELKSVSKFIDSSLSDKFDLIGFLNSKISCYHRCTNANISFSYPSLISLSSDIQILLYSVINEALESSIKYANASKISIDIKEVGDIYRVLISDNGTKYNSNEKQINRNRIKNIKARIKSIGGDVKWTHLPTGTELHFQIKY